MELKVLAVVLAVLLAVTLPLLVRTIARVVWPDVDEIIEDEHRRKRRLALVVYRTTRAHHRRHIRIVNVTPLKPGGHVMAAPVALTIGQVGAQTDTMTIAFLDQNGNPLATLPTPDTPPVWTNAPSAPGVDTFTVASGALSAVLTAVAAGSDTVNLTVVVGGVTYTASQAFTIVAAAPPPPVLASVAIINTLS